MTDYIYDDEGADAEGGATFIIHDMRDRKEVAFDAVIYDHYAPLLGSDGLGLYGIYCRIAALPKGIRRRCGQDKIAAAARIGKQKLRSLNEMLVDLGLIHQVAPDNWRKSRHIPTHTFLLSPPDRPSQEMIEKYGPRDYKPLPGWLFDDPKTAGLSGPPVEKAPVYLDRRSESADLSGPANSKSAGLSGPAKVHSLTQRVSPTKLIDSEECELSERVNPEASVMESGGEVGAIVKDVQMRLLVALQEHGWMGSGWTWNAQEQAMIVAARHDLSQQAIYYAIETWMETLDKGKRREPFHPSRSLRWLLTVCQNFDVKKGFHEYHNSSNPNGAGNGRQRAGKDACVAPTPEPEPDDDDTQYDLSGFDARPSGPAVFGVRGR